MIEKDLTGNSSIAVPPAESSSTVVSPHQPTGVGPVLGPAQAIFNSSFQQEPSSYLHADSTPEVHLAHAELRYQNIGPFALEALHQVQQDSSAVEHLGRLLMRVQSITQADLDAHCDQYRQRITAVIRALQARSGSSPQDATAVAGPSTSVQPLFHDDHLLLDNHSSHGDHLIHDDHLIQAHALTGVQFGEALYSDAPLVTSDHELEDDLPLIVPEIPMNTTMVSSPMPPLLVQEVTANPMPPFQSLLDGASADAGHNTQDASEDLDFAKWLRGDVLDSPILPLHSPTFIDSFQHAISFALLYAINIKCIASLIEAINLISHSMHHVLRYSPL